MSLADCKRVLSELEQTQRNASDSEMDEWWHREMGRIDRALDVLEEELEEIDSHIKPPPSYARIDPLLGHDPDDWSIN